MHHTKARVQSVTSSVSSTAWEARGESAPLNQPPAALARIIASGARHHAPSQSCCSCILTSVQLACCALAPCHSMAACARICSVLPR